MHAQSVRSRNVKKPFCGIGQSARINSGFEGVIGRLGRSYLRAHRGHLWRMCVYYSKKAIGDNPAVPS